MKYISLQTKTKKYRIINNHYNMTLMELETEWKTSAVEMVFV